MLEDIGQDTYLCWVDTKGKTRFTQHRTWDRKRFIESCEKQVQDPQSGLKAVRLAHRGEYLQARNSQ